MIPTPMTASKGVEAVVVPAYSLMSNPTNISAAENGYMLAGPMSRKSTN